LEFRELKITDFGKFHQKNISLKEGVNLIYGENEAGKSTLHGFLRGMLFGIDKPRGRASKEDIYTRFQPWENPSLYRGSLDFSVEGKNYRIIRNFDKNNKSTTFLDLETGRELETLNIQELLGGLTESGYVNTISMEQQKIRTGAELAGEVRNYITNLSLTKNNEVDVNKALVFLQNKKRELEGKRPLQELKDVKILIEKAIALEQKADSLTNQLNTITGALAQAEARCLSLENKELAGERASNYESLLLKVPLIRDKIADYESNKIQMKELEEALKALDYELAIRLQTGSNELKEGLDSLKVYQKKKESLENEKSSLLNETSSRKEGKGTKGMLAAVLGMAGLCGSFLGAVNLSRLPVLNNLLFAAGVLLFLSGAVIGILYTNGLRKQKHHTGNLLVQIENELIKNRKKREELLNRYGIKEENDLSVLYEKALKREIEGNFKEEQKKDYIRQRNRLGEKQAIRKEEIIQFFNQFPFFGEDVLKQEYIPNSKDLDRVINYLEEKQQEVQRTREELYGERDRLKLNSEQIKWELNAFAGKEEELFLYQERENNLKEKDEEIQTELKAVVAAISTIKILSQQIHDSFGSTLNRKISELLAGFTEEKYNRIVIDENLEMKAEISEEYRSWDKLSAGTMEQFLFALRLSISDVMYQQGLPLLLDDCFAYYDDKRTRNALEYLAESGRQILLFTCHNREREILESIGTPFHYIDLGSHC
jgi:energy-coupling factor transporter ATP-binding protein EcfA2